MIRPGGREDRNPKSKVAPKSDRWQGASSSGKQRYDLVYAVESHARERVVVRALGEKTNLAPNYCSSLSLLPRGRRILEYDVFEEHDAEEHAARVRISVALASTELSRN